MDLMIIVILLFIIVFAFFVIYLLRKMGITNSKKKIEESSSKDVKQKISETISTQISATVLSEKYKILIIFKYVLFVIVGLAIIGNIAFVKQILDTKTFDDIMIIIPILSTALLIFMTYCGVMLINFVFELDQTKENVKSEKRVDNS